MPATAEAYIQNRPKDHDPEIRRHCHRCDCCNLHFRNVLHRQQLRHYEEDNPRRKTQGGVRKAHQPHGRNMAVGLHADLPGVAHVIGCVTAWLPKYDKGAADRLTACLSMSLSRPSSGMETGTTAPRRSSMPPGWNRALLASRSSSTTASHGKQTRSGARFASGICARTDAADRLPLSGVSLPHIKTCQRIMLFSGA